MKTEIPANLKQGAQILFEVAEDEHRELETGEYGIRTTGMPGVIQWDGPTLSFGRYLPCRLVSVDEPPCAECGSPVGYPHTVECSRFVTPSTIESPEIRTASDEQIRHETDKLRSVG